MVGVNHALMDSYSTGILVLGSSHVLPSLFLFLVVAAAFLGILEWVLTAYPVALMETNALTETTGTKIGKGVRPAHQAVRYAPMETPAGYVRQALYLTKEEAVVRSVEMVSDSCCLVTTTIQ